MKKVLLPVAALMTVLLVSGTAVAHHRPDHGGGKPSPSPTASPDPDPTPEPTPDPTPTPDPEPRAPQPCVGAVKVGDPPGLTVERDASCEAVPGSETLTVWGAAAGDPIRCVNPFYPIDPTRPTEWVCFEWTYLAVEVTTPDGVTHQVCQTNEFTATSCSGQVQVEPYQPVTCSARAYNNSWTTLRQAAVACW